MTRPHPDSEQPAPPITAAAPDESATARDELVIATHAALFGAEGTRQCDACGQPLTPGHGLDDEGFAVEGEGVYLWTRGTEVRFEKAPLCASCASAIGMTALARWEIEEEEG
jgi:hypothetical protein